MSCNCLRLTLSTAGIPYILLQLKIHFWNLERKLPRCVVKVISSMCVCVYERDGMLIHLICWWCCSGVLSIPCGGPIAFFSKALPCKWISLKVCCCMCITSVQVWQASAYMTKWAPVSTSCQISLLAPLVWHAFHLWHSLLATSSPV